MIQIPLTNDPSQTFTIIIDDIEYSFRVIYNTREATWSLEVEGGDFTVAGVNMVGGVDILKQHPIPLKNVYMINVSGLTEDATLDNLGTEAAMIVATDEEIEGFQDAEAI